MKKLYIALCTALAVGGISCSKEDLRDKQESLQTSQVSPSNEEEIIFEPSSIIVRKGKARSLSTNNHEEWLVDDNILKGLGRSYWFQGEQFIEQELKAPVINIRTLVRDPELEGSITINSLRQMDIETNAYRDYKETRTENRRYKKAGGGLKLNFKIFTLGFSSSYERMFYSLREHFDTALFGEASLVYKGKDITLNTSVNTRASIIERHLYPGFIRSLYNNPIGTTSESVGPLVLCGYRMGGRLNAQYLERHTTQFAKDTAYRNFSAGLHLSFKLDELTQKKDKDPKDKQTTDRRDSLRVNYTQISSSGNTNKRETDKRYVNISTIGGEPAFQINIPVFEIKNTPNIDLSPWMRSLSDEKKHALIDVQDNGLIPLSEFVLEENFKRRLTDIYKGILEANKVNLDPRIEITKVFVRYSRTGEPLCDIALVLNTRNEDKLILTPINEQATDQELERNNSRETFIRRGKELVASINNVFKGLKKSGKLSSILYPYMRTTLSSNAVVNYTKLKRYHNPITKIIYIYDEQSKVAFSFYQGDEGDKDLAYEYGIADFVETLSEKKISVINLLQNYRVLGL